MIDRRVSTRIDAQKCTGCGLCVRVCPDRTLTLIDGKAVVTGDRSLNCGHCAAVCPVDAVRVAALDDRMQSFETFAAEGDAWLAPGEFDPALLVRLMRSRRSCRNYREQPVDPACLADLVKIGITAPSGTNSQKWTFTVLPDRAAVMELGKAIGRYFRRLNRMAAKKWLRGALTLLGRPQLEDYYREYFESVREALDEWEKTGRERLFHGATAAIVVGSQAGASCPMEDALLATQNMLLGAHAMGLGSCLIGFAVAAMQKEPAIKSILGIPRGEAVYAVIGLGHPDETYSRPAGRKMPLVRWVG